MFIKYNHNEHSWTRIYFYSDLLDFEAFNDYLKYKTNKAIRIYNWDFIIG
jgi:hypothetical protein